MITQSMGTERGAQWAIWDLHVHTPASIVNGYGGSSDEVWEKFVADLESLPSDIRVVGINDYWFLDGYKKLLAEKKLGRLRNIERIFPIVEMRLEQFGGTESNLARANLHVIFDPDLDPSVIEAQFLNALGAHFKLDAQSKVSSWQGVITRDSLADLGREIKASVPGDQLHKFGSDLIEGFNNLNVAFQEVEKLLMGSSYLRGKYLLGLGKAEWSQIKWNGQAIASKKNIISSVDLLFSAFQDPSTWADQVSILKKSSVNYKIVDCSDAHYFSDSPQNERLGQCHAWFNTIPTLAGLAHALREFDHRVYVGLEPPALGRIRRNPERFIESISVGSSDPEYFPLFNYCLPLNTGFVAVVGNKGHGKSALLDCVALAGNSRRNNEFAFLNLKRFLAYGNRAAGEYHTEINWKTGLSRRTQLNGGHDSSVPVSVEYLQQAFVERICNLNGQSEGMDEFEVELREILFTHIPEDERSGEKAFDDLLSRKVASSRELISRLRSELGRRIAAYIEVANFRSSNPLEDIVARIDLKREEIELAKKDHAEALATLATMDGGARANRELDQLRSESEECESELEVLRDRSCENDHAIGLLERAESDLEWQIRRIDEIKDDLGHINEEIAGIIGVEAAPEMLLLRFDDTRVKQWRTKTDADRNALSEQYGFLCAQIEAKEVKLATITDTLANADGTRELARQRALQSKSRIDALIGSIDDEQSLLGLESVLASVETAPDRMDLAREAMFGHAELIHSALIEQLKEVRGLYEPAARFIESSEVVKSAGFEFQAELRVMPTWRNVAGGLDGRRTGDLSEWLIEVPSRVDSSNWEDLSIQFRELVSRLEGTRGRETATYRNPGDALRSQTSLEDFLAEVFELGWLDVRFGLIGDGLPLSRLSPGQRGLILALFYLVVDRRTTPLLLDQPEENLDNATIATLLVPAIREAAGRRQTIVVTHNANLAVVGDADQIVHCVMEDGKFTISSGSISQIDVARFAVEILEGTKSAFDNRKNKYEAFPDL